jgi:hypothetical protein
MRDGAVQPSLLEHVVSRLARQAASKGIMAGANVGSRPRGAMRAAAHQIEGRGSNPGTFTVPAQPRTRGTAGGGGGGGG